MKSSQSQPPLSIPDDAFRHVPSLAKLIKHPDESGLRLSYDRFEELDAIGVAENWPPDWRLPHEHREATRASALKGRIGQDIWIFAYGSLIWDPSIYFDQVRTAHLDGWHRRFCMSINGGRGSRDEPGLMAALDKGGECSGIAFRVPGKIMDAETEILWMREMIVGSYRPIFVPVSTPQGEIEALAFVMETNHEQYLPNIELYEAAGIIARAEGFLGPNFEYLNSLCGNLKALGIRDENMEKLLELATTFQEASKVRNPKP